MSSSTPFFAHPIIFNMSITENYYSAINYLNNKVNFESLINPAKSVYKMTIEPLIVLDEKLQKPHQSLKIIHIAGTKGKGSVSFLLEHYLRSLGYSTGLFTSPHLYKVNERVRINGQELSDEQFAEMIGDFRVIIEPDDDKNLTYFETMTFAAFLYFKKKQVDWLILETGLGGRLDATNIVTPVLSVITRIDLDHTQLLGSTHELIATEKAGIIKMNTPVIALQQRTDVNQVFEKISKEKNAPLFFASATLAKQLFLENLNSAEIENFSVVKKVLKKLNEILKIAWDDEKIKALTTVKLPGRYEIFAYKNKTIMLDVAHNYISYLKLIEKIKQQYPSQKIAFAFNSSRDKDIEKMGELIKQTFTEIYILPVKDNSRIFTPSELAEKIKTGKTFADLKQGVEFILEHSPAEVIVFTGSFYLIGEVGRYFNRNANLK